MLRVVSTLIHSKALIATSQVFPAKLGKIFPSSARKKIKVAIFLRDHDTRILVLKIYILLFLEELSFIFPFNFSPFQDPFKTLGHRLNLTQLGWWPYQRIDSHFVQRPFHTKTISHKGDHFVQRPLCTKTISYKGDHLVQKHKNFVLKFLDFVYDF